MMNLNPVTLLKQTNHRPWPLSSQPWVMSQTWQQLLFAHWPISPQQLAPFIPKGLELDLFEGEAWLTIVPFKMGYKFRYSPICKTFGELNVRTYVVRDGKPGVFFLSLDAADWFIVQTARRIYALPYHLARVQLTSQDNCIQFSSYRKQYQFQASYHPTSSAYYADANTLEAWLTERYCLYSVSRRGILFRGDVHHIPWPLQQAKGNIILNTLDSETGLHLPSQPALLQYVEHLDIIVWPPEKLLQ